MNETQMKTEKKRWPLALLIVAAVVVASAAIIYNYRDAPGTIPVQVISDGSGGVIATWQDNKGLYTQHIDSSGRQTWENKGIPIVESNTHVGLSLISDGLGGAIITWEDASVRPESYDDPGYFNPIPFYSSRLGADGKFAWSDAVIASGTAQLSWGLPRIVSDNDGGAIYAWNNSRTYYRGLHDDYLRLQKISPDGRRLWGDEGVLLVASSPYRPLTDEEKASGIKGTIHRSWPTFQGTFDIVSDGDGGTIVFWEEEIANNRDRVYAQRLYADGSAAWPEPVNIGDGSYLYQSAESDGTGGAYLGISSEEMQTSYSRHISGDGQVQDNGYFIYGTISDGLGGSFRLRVQEDPPYGPPTTRHQIPYIQRTDNSGRDIWPERRIFPEELPEYGSLKYVADGTGGVIIVWDLQKERVAYSNIAAKRLDAAGVSQWGEVGIPAFSVPGVRYQKVVEILSDGSSGALVIAALGKDALLGDMIYAQHLDVDGSRLWGDGVRVDR